MQTLHPVRSTCNFSVMLTYKIHLHPITVSQIDSRLDLPARDICVYDSSCQPAVSDSCQGSVSAQRPASCLHPPWCTAHDSRSTAPVNRTTDTWQPIDSTCHTHHRHMTAYRQHLSTARQTHDSLLTAPVTRTTDTWQPIDSTCHTHDRHNRLNWLTQSFNWEDLHNWVHWIMNQWQCLRLFWTCSKMYQKAIINYTKVTFYYTVYVNYT